MQLKRRAPSEPKVYVPTPPAPVVQSKTQDEMRAPSEPKEQVPQEANPSSEFSHKERVQRLEEGLQNFRIKKLRQQLKEAKEQIRKYEDIQNKTPGTGSEPTSSKRSKRARTPSESSESSSTIG